MPIYACRSARAIRSTGPAPQGLSAARQHVNQERERASPGENVASKTLAGSAD